MIKELPSSSLTAVTLGEWRLRQKRVFLLIRHMLRVDIRELFIREAQVTLPRQTVLTGFVHIESNSTWFQLKKNQLMYLFKLLCGLCAVEEKGQSCAFFSVGKRSQEAFITSLFTKCANTGSASIQPYTLQKPY